MSGKTGTHDISTLLATRTTSAAKFGLDTIDAVITAELEAHNGDIAEVSTDRQRISGASSPGEMKTVDEYGRGPTQKPGDNAQVAFPLTLFQYAIGWTRTWEQEKTPADFAIATQNAEIAHRKKVVAQIKRALFGVANYSITDDLVDNIVLAVKRLVNADSAPIPEGPNGEIFTASSHTHYLANATLTAAAAQSAIDTVVEHGHGSQVRVYIAQANEAAFRALTGFVAYLDPRLTLGTQANQPGKRLDITRMNNRAIGLFGAAEVWVKPWMIANYMFAFDAGASGKPLVVRERVDGSMGLRKVAEIDAHPLHAQYMEAKFDVGVWTRTNGAILQFNNGTYQVPTITG
jgi:hypothetical protein